MQTHTTRPLSGGMQLTDLVPEPPNEPMYLITDNPTLPYGGFKYDLDGTTDPGFLGIVRRPTPASGEGFLWTYHWGAGSTLQITYRELTTTPGGLMQVIVADQELQVGLDGTGFNAGDLIIWDGTNFVPFQLDDGSGSQYPVAAGEALRFVRGDVNDDGSEGHGNIDPVTSTVLWTSSNTATGRFSVSFAFAFPDVPAVTLGVNYNVPSNRPRIINFTSPPATGGFAVAIQEWDGAAWVDIDVAFHFQAAGLNGNY